MSCRLTAGFAALITLSSLITAPATALGSGGLEARMAARSTTPAALTVTTDEANGGSYVVRRGRGRSESGIGQTFRLDAALDLASISVLSVGESCSGALRLVVGRFVDLEDGTMREILWKASAPVRAETSGSWITFDFEPLPLEAGLQYGFLIRWDRPRGGCTLRLAHNGGDVYSSGRPFLLAGYHYKPVYDDLVFELRGVPRSVPSIDSDSTNNTGGSHHETN